MSNYERARQAVIELYNTSPEIQETFDLGNYSLFITFYGRYDVRVPYSFSLYQDGSVMLATHAPFNNTDREDVRRLREIVRDYLTGILAENASSYTTTADL
jgi:hypothetical protein